MHASQSVMTCIVVVVPLLLVFPLGFAWGYTPGLLVFGLVLSSHFLVIVTSRKMVAIRVFKLLVFGLVLFIIFMSLYLVVNRLPFMCVCVLVLLGLFWERYFIALLLSWYACEFLR